MPTDTDEPRTAQVQEPVLAICSECPFVEATEAESHAEVHGTEDDPAFVHHFKTGHNAGSFQPTEHSDLHDYWYALQNRLDQSNIPRAEKLWELATGQETEA